MRVDSGQDHHRELQALDPVHGRQPDPRLPRIVLLLQNHGWDLRRLEERLVAFFQQLAGAGDQADLFRLLVLQQVFHRFHQERPFGFRCVEPPHLGRLAGQERPVPFHPVLFAVEVVHLNALQQGHRPVADLLRRPVVDLQLARPALDLDAAVLQDDLPPIDALVGVSD